MLSGCEECSKEAFTCFKQYFCISPYSWEKPASVSACNLVTWMLKSKVRKRSIFALKCSFWTLVFGVKIGFTYKMWHILEKNPNQYPHAIWSHDGCWNLKFENFISSKKCFYLRFIEKRLIFKKFSWKMIKILIF